MKRLNKAFVGLLSACTLLTVASCNNREKETIEKENVEQVSSSSSLYVNKVEGLSDDFIMGMDASSLISEENSGVKYYDYDGKEADALKIFSESGINYIRVRIWNDPYNKDGKGYGGGNNDVKTAVEIGKRATKYGMKLLVDFHYSDFWADPAKQTAPKAWEDMKIDEKKNALYSFTKSALEDLYYAGVEVGMVQLGNETNGKMAGETAWSSICGLMNEGAKATREVFKDALVAVHFTNPEKEDRYDYYADFLKKNDVDYDVFASSYYPYWHGTLENLQNVLNGVAEKYDKKVMVAETSYAYTSENYDGWPNTIGTPTAGDGNDYGYPVTVAGQANHVRNVIDTVAHTKNGIGVFYWEGAWISVGSDYSSNQVKWEQYGSGWASSAAVEYDPDDAGKWYGGCAVENQAFFDNDGKVLESLKVFNLVKTGNTEVPKYVDGTEALSVTFVENEEFVLPTTASVIYNTNEHATVDVTWDGWTTEMQQKAKTSGNAKYQIHGIASGSDVYLTLNVLEYNYANNYSFENQMANWTANITGTLNDDYKVGITTENPATGSYGYHFWSNFADTCKFTIEQKITENGHLYNATSKAYDGDTLTAGTYKYSVSFVCGGSGSDSLTNDLNNMYSYVKINGEIVKQTRINGASWNDGQVTYLMKDIQVAEGDTVIIGVYVEANQAGAWGSIDDVMFNKQR